MKTLFRETPYRILRLLYENRNAPVHLREIVRRLKLNESSVSRAVAELTQNGMLHSEKDGNMRKFSVKTHMLPVIFRNFDYERLESLPLLRKNAVKGFIKDLKPRPLLAVVFGSTAKDTFKEGSDIDILLVQTGKTDYEGAIKYAESMTGMRIHVFSISEREFEKELKMREDKTVQAAIATGFPVFNEKLFYEMKADG